MAKNSAWRWQWFVATVFLLLTPILASGKSAARPAPEGWGGAKLGMSWEEFRGIFPQAEELEPVPDMPGRERARRAVAWKIKEADVAEPLDLEFRFWEGRLWMILVYATPLTQPAFQAFLERRFGPPPVGGEQASWIWPTVKIVANTKQRWFALFDRRLANEVQAALFGTPGTSRKSAESVRTPRR